MERMMMVRKKPRDYYIIKHPSLLCCSTTAIINLFFQDIFESEEYNEAKEMLEIYDHRCLIRNL